MTVIASLAPKCSLKPDDALPALLVDGLSLTQRSDIGAALVSVAMDDDDTLETLAMLLSIALPRGHGDTVIAGELQAVWMTPRSWLVLGPPDVEIVVCNKVTKAYPDRAVHAARFSDYLCWFDLSGPGAEDALKQGSFISFRREGLGFGQAKRTLVAGIAAVLLRQTDNVWLVGVERSRATYFHTWLKSLTI